jgi:predicted metal-dependent peptidase
MIIKNIHEKLLNGIQTMLIDTQINLPYYGNFNLHINFHEQDSIGTCAVNVSSKGMNFFYSPKFLENMSQKEVNFITLHENFHLLFDHPKRTVSGQYDHKLSNIVQDMIINHIIWEDISHSFVEIPKTSEGKNMALFVPKEYKGKLIFEELYMWMKEEKDKWQQNKSKDGKDDKSDDKSDDKGKGSNKSNGKGNEKGNEKGEESGEVDGDSNGKPSYGPYGKNPGKDGDSIETWSKEKIFEDMETNNGEYLDKHIGDDVPEDMREAMVRDVMDRLTARGYCSGNVETTLNKLQKKRKDYLKEIKRAVSNMIFGTVKQATIVKPNRKQISGIKGKRKIKTKINVGLDVSGSMGGQGTFERVLSYVYRNDIEINFMESDTKINWVQNIKNQKQLASIPIKGLGGTCLQPIIDHIVENFNDCNSVLLTDGYTDTLDCSKLKGKLLIISVGTKCPISKSNGKVKQIVIEGNEK